MADEVVKERCRDGDTPVGLANLGATCYANSLMQVRTLRPLERRNIALSLSLSFCLSSLIYISLSLYSAIDLVPRYGLQEGGIQVWSRGDKGGGGEDAQ